MTAGPADELVAPTWPDWRDAEQYRHMVDLDRAGWAWEWLRRNPGYADQRKKSPTPDLGRKTLPGFCIPHLMTDPVALRWGLCFR